MSDTLIGVREAGHLLGVHENTVRNWAANGKLAVKSKTALGAKLFDPDDVEQLRRRMYNEPIVAPTYHDLHITTADIPRTSIFDLPYGLWVTCNRVAGWELWEHVGASPGEAVLPNNAILRGGEYAGPDKWLVLDVAGHIIVDSRRQEPE